MKKLALAIAAVFLLTGIAAATDFTLTGSYYARGSWKDNLSGQGTNVEDYQDYDHELSVDATWQIDDTTKVFARFEIADEVWGKSQAGNGGTINEGGAAYVDENIYAEQVWAQHTFANGGTLAVGKMSAGAWATSFNDTGDEGYRVKWTQPTSFGTIIALVQKLDTGERGATAKTAATDLYTTGAGEGEDDDAYVIAMVTKIGDINVKPLIGYADFASETAAYEREVLDFKLGLDGAMGNFSFEFEFDYQDNDQDGDTNDYSVWGAYLNVWTQMDALKIGALVAYGSEDNGFGFDFGDDFEAGGALLMGDDITFAGGNDLTAGRLIAVYFDYAINDALTWGAYLGFATCGIDDNSAWDDADVWEISTDLTYKITPNVTYKVAVGTAQLEWGNNTADPDNAFEAYHKLSFSF